MSFITKFLSSIPAVVFLIIGVFWVLQPGIMAENFGMVLSSDLGLSSQIGDLGSYFVSSALMIFLWNLYKQYALVLPAHFNNASNSII